MNISEKPQWENNISMLARQQKVEGGRDGAANIQAQQLTPSIRFCSSISSLIRCR